MPTPNLNSMGILELINQAGLVAKIVLLLLLSASILCWTIIISKWKTLQLALEQNEKFLHMFWSEKSIDEIVNKCEKFRYSPVAAVFKNGVKELRKLSLGETGNSSTPSSLSSSSQSLASSSERVETIHRALIRASTAEISILEKNVSWLATTASAAPFVGLFGTVWGIMNSFQNIGASGSAHLAVVAPGISEALITTATGIAAAIPAIIAYNYFAGQIKRVAIDMECFSQDFVNIVQRSFLSGRKGN